MPKTARLTLKLRTKLQLKSKNSDHVVAFLFIKVLMSYKRCYIFLCLGIEGAKAP